MKRTVYVIGGGTVFHVRPHLALMAPAYGTLAREILSRLAQDDMEDDVVGVFTKMADPSSTIETNEDLSRYVDTIIADPTAKLIFMTAAVLDFDGHIGEIADCRYPPGKEGDFLPTASGKDQPRLLSSKSHLMQLRPAEKILSKIRRTRKDIFLVACKTTAGATPDAQFIRALELLKKNSCNLVLANDVHTRFNMVVTPEESRYCETTDRGEAIDQLVNMAWSRSSGTFTRSTIVAGDPIPWGSPLVPASLRAVVDHCIKRGAYKSFGPTGATAGHFAVKVNNNTFLTSRRKSNFNQLEEVGLVMVKTEGTDRVIAYGSPPSVGGQSQRIVFEQHPDVDCIVHFHCPLKSPMSANIPIRPQWGNECGSHQCGRNTSEGLRRFGNVYAVMLDNHGPNVVFHRDTDPEEVIRFIETNFDLDQKTDGIHRFKLLSEEHAHG